MLSDGTILRHSAPLTKMKTWSMPVLMGDDLLIRDDKNWMRLRPKK